MSPRNTKNCLRAAALPALIVALLTVAIAQPAHAQGLLNRFKEASKVIKEKAEKADSTVRNVEESMAAAKCLANDADCAERQEVSRSPEVVADSGRTLLPSPPDTVSAPGQCERARRAPPDSGQVSSRRSPSRSPG